MSAFPGHTPSRPQQEAPPSSSARRSYHSKRNRPCALCRSRKISCRTVENAVSCISCRKAGKHCSFIDDPAKRSDSRGSNPEIIESDSSGRRGGGVEPLATNTFNLQPTGADGTSGLATEGTYNWDSNNASFDHDMSFDDLTNRDHLDLSSFYQGAQNLTVTGLPDGQANTTLYGIDPQQQSSTTAILSDDTYSVNNSVGLSADVALANSLPVQIAPADQPPAIAAPIRQITSGMRANADSTSDQRKEPNSIDQRSDFHGSYFGLSGESDPYLLRHYLYNESNELPWFRLTYRSTETLPLESSKSSWQTPGFDDPTPTSRKSQVPIQFILTSNEIGEEAQKVGPTPNPGTPQSIKLELDKLVRDEHGRRLILLFMEYVFPALPVISRSQLVRSTLSLHHPASQNLETIPPYLLAAIYASALEFWSYDDVLCISSIYQKPSAEKLWQMVYDGIQSQLHSPRLATISASLLYLNKPRVGVQQISADTSFTWAFTASTVALATSLGLHLDCCSWSIPKWEKRLRRRLWWSTFSEEKWRSLLLGRPSIIARDQWNVSELTNDDFEMDEVTKMELNQELPTEIEKFSRLFHSSGKKPEKTLLSQQIVSLAFIADNIYTTLYTVRAAQLLADDLDASIDAIRPLREGLVLWYSRLPEPLKSPKNSSSDVSVPLVPNSVACLHFAYLTLEVLLYRALLRPLETVDFGQDLVESQTGRQSNNGSGPGVGTSLDVPDIYRDLESFGTIEREHQASFLGQAEAIVCAAEKCAIVVTTFTAELMSWDFAGFWFSWSRIGFATITSFLALLFVQSPSLKHATTCKILMDKWRQILRHQSKSFQHMSLGMLRLDAIYWSDMRKIFRVNRHVEKVLNDSS